MKRSDVKSLLAVCICMFVINLPAMGANVPVGKVLPRSGNSQVNGTDLLLETTVYSGDNIATKADSLALIELPYGEQIHVGPASSATLTRVDDTLVVGLQNGIVRAKSSTSAVNARGLVIRPAETATYDVAVDNNAVYVHAREGSVAVVGKGDSFVVPAEKTMKFELAANTAPGATGIGADSMTPGQAAAIVLAISLGVSLGIELPLLLNEIDDAEKNACVRAIQAVSPSAPTSGC